MNILIQVLRDILAFIGAVAGVYYIVESVRARWRPGWRRVSKAAEEIGTALTADQWDPTLIFGIGRGGAILGALISGVLGHRPLVVIDRSYRWREGERVDDLFERVNLTSKLERVLLVAGEVHSGNTMRLYREYLTKLGAKQVRLASFLFQKGATQEVHYKGFITQLSDVRLPWMLTSAYRREDRSPVEARTLSA